MRNAYTLSFHCAPLVVRSTCALLVVPAAARSAVTRVASVRDRRGLAAHAGVSSIGARIPRACKLVRHAAAVCSPGVAAAAITGCSLRRSSSGELMIALGRSPPPPLHAAYSFARWCDFMEQLCLVPSKTEKERIICSHLESTIAANESSDGAELGVVLTLRLALAREDLRAYHIGEKRVVRYLGELFASTRSSAVVGGEGDSAADAWAATADVTRFAAAVREGGDLSATAMLFATESRRARAVVGMPAATEHCPRSRGGSSSCQSASPSPPTLSSVTGLTLQHVDELLTRFTTLTRLAEQQETLQGFVNAATPLEIKWFIRLLQHDLRIGAQAATFLSALDQVGRCTSRGVEDGSNGGSPSRSRNRVATPGAGAWELYRSGTDLAAIVRSVLRANPRAARGVLGARISTSSSASPESPPGPLGSEDTRSSCRRVDAAVAVEALPTAPAVHMVTRTSDCQEPTDTVTSAVPDLQPGVPVKPQLAEAVSSMEAAVQKCGPRFVAEIKYDGVRVQVHLPGALHLHPQRQQQQQQLLTSGEEGTHALPYQFFSRSGKPVKRDQVEDVSRALPAAFPRAISMILDGELLLLSPTGAMLPFGTLGTEARKKHPGAHPVLFVFDVLYFNGVSCMGWPWHHRRGLLERNFSPAQHAVRLSEATHIGEDAAGDEAARAHALRTVFDSASACRLEGLIVKDASGKYEPGRRRWIKLKRDYVVQGVAVRLPGEPQAQAQHVPPRAASLADSVDLVVLGSYYGKGAYGGQQSVWLLGTRSESEPGTWVTVAKVGNGVTDADVLRLNSAVSMQRVQRGDPLPAWLHVAARSLRPDFVVTDPACAPVWEITGHALTPSPVHSSGVSMRFPRLFRERSDKSPTEATTLSELRRMLAASMVSE